MPLRGLLALSLLRIASVQVEHVVLSVVVGMVEGDRSDSDVYSLHDRESRPRRWPPETLGCYFSSGGVFSRPLGLMTLRPETLAP